MKNINKTIWFYFDIVLVFKLFISQILFFKINVVTFTTIYVTSTQTF